MSVSVILIRNLGFAFPDKSSDSFRKTKTSLCMEDSYEMLSTQKLFLQPSEFFEMWVYHRSSFYWVMGLKQTERNYFYL